MVEISRNLPETQGNPQNPFFETLFRGSFSRNAIAVDTQIPRLRHPGFVNFVIDQWEKNGSADSCLRRTWTFNERPTVVNNVLHLPVAQGNFMGFESTRQQNVRDFYPDDIATVDPIATSILVATRDGKLLVAAKKENDGTRPMTVISGYPEIPLDPMRRDEVPDIDRNGNWDPFVTITRELGQESGVRSHELYEISVNGLTINNSVRSKQPILSFFARTFLTSEQIRNRDNCGEVDIRFIPDSRDAIEDLLLHAPSMIRTGMASLLLYGRMVYGENWYGDMQSGLSETYSDYMSFDQKARNELRMAEIAYFHTQSTS